MGNYRGGEGSTHWYASPKTVEMGGAEYAGQPIEKVPGAKAGTWVNATTPHAIRWHLAPGVTGVLGYYAKNALIDWAAKAAAVGAVVGPAGEVDSSGSLAAQLFRGELQLKDFQEKCLDAKDAVVKKSTDRGTLIHKALEQAYLGEAYDPVFAPWVTTVQERLRSHYPGVIEWVPERPFWHKSGFGGRTDLVGHGAKGEIVIVDFKTRDFQPKDIDEAVRKRASGFKGEGRLTPRETEPMQLVANLIGHGGVVDGEVSNLYVDRTLPICHLRPYSAEEQAKALTCFNALLTIFKTQRGITGGAE